MTDDQQWMDSFAPSIVESVLTGDVAPDHLKGAFVFSATPEGEDYWYEECQRTKLRPHIKNKLKKMLAEHKNHHDKQRLET